MYMRSKLSGRQESGDGFALSIKQALCYKEKDLSLIPFTGTLTHWGKGREH